MKYFCTGCDYYYDEMNGDLDLGIEPGTLFSELPDDFVCPVCFGSKENFVVLKESINYPIDINNLSDKEAEYIPEYNILGDILSYNLEIEEDISEETDYVYKVLLFDEEGEIIDEHKYTLGESINGKFDISYLDQIELQIFWSRSGIFSTGLIKR